MKNYKRVIKERERRLREKNDERFGEMCGIGKGFDFGDMKKAQLV